MTSNAFRFTPAQARRLRKALDECRAAVIRLERTAHKAGLDVPYRFTTPPTRPIGRTTAMHRPLFDSFDTYARRNGHAKSGHSTGTKG